MAVIRKILVVEDMPMIQNLFIEAFSSEQYYIKAVSAGEEALERLEKESFDLVIVDVRLPGMSGLEFLERLDPRKSGIGVIMMTAFASVSDAVQAMRKGAFDYMTKPFTIDEIEVVINKYFDYHYLLSENRQLRQQVNEKGALANLIGRSEAMKQVIETVQMAAQDKATVLIQGPSGTGKGVVASIIHQLSDRRDGPFIKTNCAALPESLIESELFGHERGAFTGAVKSTKGRFEAAHGGTLLLDEISEMSPKLQAKLLHVLQEKEVARIGNVQPIHIDVRIIAITNKDLRQEIQNGNFREDLFYRLNVLPIFLPPLCERKEDIPLLAEHFLRKFAAESKKDIRGIDERVFEQLMCYHWPGNVRELENIIQRAVAYCHEDMLLPHHITFIGAEDNATGEAISTAPTIVHPANLTLREIEKQMIFRALAMNKNNRTRAAQMLGISVRTIRNKLREYREHGELPQEFLGFSNAENAALARSTEN
jgi:DNA-binding NtrC family response regulator